MTFVAEDISPEVLSVKTKCMKVCERACHEEGPSVPIG